MPDSSHIPPSGNGTPVAPGYRMTSRAGIVCCAFLLLTSSGRLDSQPTGVQLDMKNVRLHVDEGIVLDVTRLRGVMISKVAGRPPIFDDQRSYVMRLQTADMSMDMMSLQNLMNRHVFAYEGSPLTDLKVAADGARLTMKGKLHKGVAVPFSTTASVSTSPDGRM